MEFRVLGALAAGPSGAAVELGPPKQRALLAILLLHVGEIVPVDRLIDLLWGDDPPRTADHSIQIYVSELRKTLEPLAGRRLIVRRQPGYQLDTPGDTVDATHFESLVREGSALLAVGQRAPGARMLRAALELWRGPALSDFAYEEFAQPYIRRLNDLHLDAIEELAAAELDAGQATAVVTLLEAAIREDPLRERSRELLMLALYRSGRHAEALRTFERLREQLVEELGLEPSPPLQQLRDRVLLHDPTLLPVASAEPSRGTERNPYKGLQAFGEADADDFFGRETLVERLLASIAIGQRLVALVGPSGSGKSSVIAAGLLPRLRRGAVPGSDRWVIVNAPLGPDPLGDLQTVLARISRSPVAERAGESRLRFPSLQEGARLVLVMDHFEELFTLTEETRREQFLAELARAVHDDVLEPLVILGLRADYYDRPLQHAEFSEVFVPGVIHVLPMSPRELQASIAEPAERVGVAVESKLLAELVADSVARPGSLPLLQYALTELFEQRSGTTLTMARYSALGGLRGVLSRRAEATFLGFSPAEQQVAIQVFLRLVRLGRGTADSRRRLVLSELTGLGIDSVALSAVLVAFSRHRLLTFDRDEVSREATAELAHEALLTEWERLAGWIDRYRAALRRRDALLFAVDEWHLAGRNPEYLVAGSRLAEFETWRQEGSLQLTRNELEFLDASAEHREAEQKADEVRRTETVRLVQSARRRLVGLAAAGIAAIGLGGAVLYGIVTAPPPPPAPVAFAWESGNLYTLQAIAGFDRAVDEFGLVGRKVPFNDAGARLDREFGSRDWTTCRRPN
jgi:DNA-binding SARP family transcriptional activator